MREDFFPRKSNLLISEQQFSWQICDGDFIFSIITEEFGIVGAFIVIGLFIVILQRGITISLEARDQFSKYLAFGMTFQIIFQAMLNLMVVSGMIPVTGVTLPFLSYGGSSLLITMISIGILLNISKNNN